MEDEQGQRLASLSKYLILAIQLERVTLNDLDSYKEYSPYTLVNNEVDFIGKVVNMQYF